jgi:hypothetical protein
MLFVIKGNITIFPQNSSCQFQIITLLYKEKNIFEIIFLKSKEMIEFATVTAKTGASVTHWVRYSSIISNSMAESVTNASFVLSVDQREGSNVLIVAHLLSVHSHRISLQLL